MDQQPENRPANAEERPAADNARPDSLAGMARRLSLECFHYTIFRRREQAEAAARKSPKPLEPFS